MATGYQMQADAGRESRADDEEAYWNAEQDCASCGADPAPEEEA